MGGLVEAMAKQQRNSKSEVREASFVRPSSLMKGFATVDEVATMATYLASELSSATDGAALRADGSGERDSLR